jgi:hypothetical protein
MATLSSYLDAHPRLVCDGIMVDGGHNYQAASHDMAQLMRRARCGSHGAGGPTDSIIYYNNIISSRRFLPSPSLLRGWAVPCQGHTGAGGDSGTAKIWKRSEISVSSYDDQSHPIIFTRTRMGCGSSRHRRHRDGGAAAGVAAGGPAGAAAPRSLPLLGGRRRPSQLVLRDGDHAAAQRTLPQRVDREVCMVRRGATLPPRRVLCALHGGSITPVVGGATAAATPTTSPRSRISAAATCTLRRRRVGCSCCQERWACVAVPEERAAWWGSRDMKT